MSEPNYQEILKAKIEYYGKTEAAYEFAAEEYSRQKIEALATSLVKSKVAELSKEDLKKYANGHHLTVARLKDFLNEHNLPDDAIVVVQRIEEVYYEKHHWGSYLKKGEHTFHAEQWNRDIESGKFLDKEQFPNMREEILIPFTEEQIKESMEQYHPVWSCVRYNDDSDILFLDLHY